MSTVANRESTGIQRAQAGIFALALAGVAACGDGLPTSQPAAVAIPVTNPPVLAGLRGRVDLIAGTLTFEPTGFAGIPGMSSAIYGDQYVNVRLYNSPVTRTLVGAKRLFSANVGMQNLRSHHVGDEQAGASPADTMGIYVFLNSGPTVTSTSSACPSCTVIVKNNHGTLAFSAPSQKYFHWQERLGPVGGGSDTTRSRKTWTFEADTAVTNFVFDVLLSAAWTPPNETLWRVEYSGDSLPDTQAEPRWRRILVGTGPTDSAGAGFLRIKMGTPTDLVDLHFQRRDSLTSTTNVFAEARFRLVSGTGDAHTGFGFDDNLKQIEVGLSTGEAGFIDDGYGFIQKVLITTNVYRTYQIRKFGADSAQLWIDGTQRLKVDYTDFKSNPAAGSLPSYFRFGSHGKGGVSNSSDWDHVIYQIGQSSP